MEDKVILDVTSTWKEFTFDVVKLVTFYINSTSLIDIYVTKQPNIDLNTLDKNDYTTIGGYIPVCDVQLGSGNKIYIRSKQPTGSVFYLPKGQIDPDKSIDSLYNALLDLRATYLKHVDIVNAHNVTKQVLGLDNIPNVILNTMPLNKPTTSELTSSLLMWKVFKSLSDGINAIDSDHIGLGDVANYPIATEDDLVNPLLDEAYLTVKGGYFIANRTVQSLTNVTPDTIVASKLQEQLDSNQKIYDPITIALMLTTLNVVVTSGLRVTYKENNRYFITEPLESDIGIPRSSISTSITKDPGYHYVYVDIVNNKITSASTTKIKPHYGICPISSQSDFYNTVTNLMYDKDANILKRVYIGRVFVGDDGLVQHVTSVPVGSSYKMNTGVILAPNKRYEFDNPYFGDIKASLEINLEDEWCDPYWNDQVGARAHYDRLNDKIVVQTGKMGLAMNANSSGNGFSNKVLKSTYKGTAPLKLIIERVR